MEKHTRVCCVRSAMQKCFCELLSNCWMANEIIIMYKSQNGDG